MTTSKPRRLVAASGLIGVVAGSISGAGVASAGHDDPDDWPGIDAHRVWIQAMPAADGAERRQGAVHGALQVDRSTDIGAVDINATTWTDLKIRESEAVSFGNAGDYLCTTHFTSTGCSQGRIRLRIPASRSLTDWKTLGCHENGHSAGLEHVPSQPLSCIANLGFTGRTTLTSTSTHDDFDAIADARAG
ncbi:MAG: hypothetical protein V3V01_19385 [Acidimicrobiales bacterium]